jgi:hypothetical protein
MQFGKPAPTRGRAIGRECGLFICNATSSTRCTPPPNVVRATLGAPISATCTWQEVDSGAAGPTGRRVPAQRNTVTRSVGVSPMK